MIGDQHRFNREPFVALPGVEKIVGISAIQQVSLEKLSLGAVRNSAEAAMLWREKTLYTYLCDFRDLMEEIVQWSILARRKEDVTRANESTT